jgi:hypothetical protein
MTPVCKLAADLASDVGVLTTSQDKYVLGVAWLPNDR